MAAGSWYSVVSECSSNLCSLLCALDADLISMKLTVAQIPVEPHPTNPLLSHSPPPLRENILTLCTLPYLAEKQTNKAYQHTFMYYNVTTQYGNVKCPSPHLITHPTPQLYFQHNLTHYTRLSKFPSRTEGKQGGGLKYCPEEIDKE